MPRYPFVLFTLKRTFSSSTGVLNHFGRPEIGTVFFKDRETSRKLLVLIVDSISLFAGSV